jgi:hypothetical protein
MPSKTRGGVRNRGMSNTSEVQPGVPPISADSDLVTAIVALFDCPDARARVSEIVDQHLADVRAALAEGQQELAHSRAAFCDLLTRTHWVEQQWNQSRDWVKESVRARQETEAAGTALRTACRKLIAQMRTEALSHQQCHDPHCDERDAIVYSWADQLEALTGAGGAPPREP